MTLLELVAHLREEYDLRITPRQVRFLVAEEFCPSPTGGRKFARYGEEHLAAIVRYYRLRDLGFTPAAIRSLYLSGAGFPFPLGKGIKGIKGITVVIEKELLGSGKPVEPLVEAARALFVRVFGSADGREVSGRTRPKPSGTQPKGASPAETSIPGAPGADSHHNPAPAAAAAADEGDDT